MSFEHELIRTAIYLGGPILLLIGLLLTRIQLLGQVNIRRFQALLSLNERLDRFPEAYQWIENPALNWHELSNTAKYQYEGYISAFEDIGIARNLQIISKEDFISSYGGRFSKLISSGTFEKYVEGSGFSSDNFRNLHMILQDIGKIELLPKPVQMEQQLQISKQRDAGIRVSSSSSSAGE